jgi:hypothetical protein
VTAHVAVRASAAGRPLAVFVGATQQAVEAVLDVADPDVGYKAIARLSGHLAAMWRTVYPRADDQLDPGGQLRAACLSGAQEVERVLRTLERRLSGDIAAIGLPLTAAPALLAAQLATYRLAEGELIARIEDSLPAEGCERLAHAYRRALASAPTRPHPGTPHTGPLRHLVFWLHGRWDRLLDTMDSRAGVGRDFLTAAVPPASLTAVPRASR